MILIRKVKDPYGWMGNMSPHPIKTKAGVWRTAEALFQAMRFDFAKDRDVTEAIRHEPSPIMAKMTAKRFAHRRRHEPRTDRDVDRMEGVLHLKLTQHPDLIKELDATGCQDIIEDCTNRPSLSGSFWGAVSINGVWHGHNMLGRLWVKLRDGLDEIPAATTIVPGS